MIALFKGLNLLLEDNGFDRDPFDVQVEHWRNKSEQDIQEELGLLRVAKSQWIVASVVGWQVISLTVLAVIANNLWQHDFTISLGKLAIIAGSWVSILFVLWFIANMFDKQAGFERWMRAFNMRAPLSPDADTVESVFDALHMAEDYPEVLAYKQAVMSRRQLRHEDIRIMREMGRMRYHAKLVGSLNDLGGQRSRTTRVPASEQRDPRKARDGGFDFGGGAPAH
ncbi:hypothetical protein [Pseudoxanthomonas composti]|uniref:hypothetical protein n=1 Tax=Pseudoxanthomonas composti TaxID=2137479 RepID=UPI001F50522B|nr:hypothetical protein [Pseudoxanthomonas composti]